MASEIVDDRIVHAIRRRLVIGSFYLSCKAKRRSKCAT